jgi:P27 family predicted phage terminase small subunit
MARPRKSPALKAVQGTERRDRQLRPEISERLKQPPAPPRHLSPRARTHWRRVAAAAVGIGTLTRADLSALELLSVTLATEEEAREVIAKEGMMIKTEASGGKAHPALRVMATAGAQAARLLERFGLDPRSRQSVDVRPPLPAYSGPKLAAGGEPRQQTLREFLAEGDEQHEEDMRKYDQFHGKDKK